MTIERLAMVFALLALVVLIGIPGIAGADDTDVPAGIAIAKPAGDPAIAGKPKKKSMPPWKMPGAFTQTFFAAVMVSAGSGWVSGKAYGDNPVTEAEGDGPGVGKGMHDAGTGARWLAGYVTNKGILVEGYARMGLSRGHNEGMDDTYDAWLLGLRVGYLFYSKNQLNIFGFVGAGYGSIRHRVSNVPDPFAVPDTFVRRDLYVLSERPGVDVWKKSGLFDASFGALIVWHFTPTFNLVFEVCGDFFAPDVAFNIDVAGGLAISF